VSLRSAAATTIDFAAPISVKSPSEQSAAHTLVPILTTLADRQLPVPCDCGSRLPLITVRWTSVNSRAIDGSTITTATPKTISRPVSVALGAAASSIVSVCGSS
jgi:hypothetical protein